MKQRSTYWWTHTLSVATLIALCWCAPLLALPQEVLQLSGEQQDGTIIVQGRRASEVGAPVFQAVWRNVPGAAPQFQWQQGIQVDAGVHLMLDRVLEAAIGTYLDTRIHFTRTGVVADLPPGEMATEIDALVREAVASFSDEAVFGGLSQPTRQQLERLVKIDWSQARMGVVSGDGEDKYIAIYHYVRSQREELERQVRADLLPLAAVSVLGDVNKGATEVRINSTCGTVFDEQNFLCALDLQLADTGSGGVDPALGEQLMAAMAQRTAGSSEASAEAVAPKVRKRDRWLKEELDAINQRIDRMDQRKELWELRDRMEDLEDRLSGLELDVRDMDRRQDENPLADLSMLTGRNIVIGFARNSTDLDPEYRVVLNEVFEQLARSPEDRVLITGYTDRSGDPAVNLRLSEERAKAVRNYLMQRGIGAERLLVNYYGDSRSVGRDPGERRVEVEWLR